MKSLESELRFLDRVATGERTIDGLDGADAEQQLLASVEGRGDLLVALAETVPGQLGYLASRTILRVQDTLRAPLSIPSEAFRGEFHAEECLPTATGSVTRPGFVRKRDPEWRQSL